MCSSDLDGRDDVDQLRHVGDLDDVGVIHECVEEGGDHQGVFEVVVLLQNAAETSRYGTSSKRRVLYLGTSTKSCRALPLQWLANSASGW